MLALAVVLRFVVLHGLDGREVYINPEAVTNLQDARDDDDPSKRTVDGSHCFVFLNDGKHVTVTEFCETVREQLEKAR